MELDKVPSVTKYLSIVFMVGWMGKMTVWNFLPVFFKQNVESVFLIGIITSISPLVTIILDIPAGNLVQRAGEKVTIFIGLITVFLAPIIYISAVPALFVLAKIFEGLTKALVWNGAWPLSLKSADDSVESEAVSVFLMGVNIAVILGPIIGGIIIASRGFQFTFGVWIVTAMAAIGLFYKLIGIESDGPLKSSLSKLRKRKTYFDDWRHLKSNWSNLKMPFVLIFLYSIIFSFYWLAIPLLLDKIGTGYLTMGLIFGIAAFPKAFQFLFGDLADRIGKLETIALLGFLLTPILVVLNYTSNVWVIGALFFVARTISSGISPALHALFDQRISDELESEMTGFLELFKHAGQVLGPFMAGTVASVWDINASFLAASFVSASIFVIAFSNKDSF